MKAFFKDVKKKWEILLIVFTIVGVIIKGTVVVADASKRMSAIEQTQQTMAGLQDKIFSFTMQLWGVDPAQAKKWKALPQEPPKDSSGNTLFNSPWLEVQGTDRLLMYKLVKDTTGRAQLLVDTLFVYKKDSVQTNH